MSYWWVQTPHPCIEYKYEDFTDVLEYMSTSQMYWSMWVLHRCTRVREYIEYFTDGLEYVSTSQMYRSTGVREYFTDVLEYVSTSQMCPPPPCIQVLEYMSTEYLCAGPVVPTSSLYPSTGVHEYWVLVCRPCGAHLLPVSKYWSTWVLSTCVPAL